MQVRYVHKFCFWGIFVAIIISFGAVLYASAASGQESVTYELAKKIAARYATARWVGSRVGEGQLYYAPDGKPEVYFFVVFKKDVAEKSVSTLLEETATLRSRRIETEKSTKKVSTDVAKGQSVVVKNLWKQMSSPDKYGTVVIGAHEGREPFIASYSGLPPHIVLREDAIETARLKLRGKRPNNIKHIWQPPLFVALEVSEKRKTLDKVQLEVRGTKLHQIKTLPWKRPKLENKALQKRKQKWQSWRRCLSEN